MNTPNLNIKRISRRPTLSDIVCQQIIDLIRESELKPGDTLPPQDDLAASLGVSKGSLREALVKLELRGFLQKERGGSYRIRGLTEKSIADPFRDLMDDDPTLVWEVLEMAKILAVEAARIAASRAEEKDVSRLEEVLLRMEKTVGNKEYFRKEFVNIYTDFFQVLGEATRNNVFMHTLHTFNQMIREAMPLPVAALRGVPNIVETIYGQFRSIHECVEQRRESEAARQTRRHFEFIEEKLRKAIMTRDRPARNKATRGG